MSRLDELIADLCPDGVELKALGDVGTFQRGNGLQKKDLVGDGVGAIHYGQVFTTYGTSTRTTTSFVAADLAARLRRASPGDLVVATTSENDEDVCKAVAWLGDSEIAVSGDAYVYSHSLDPMYVAYFFQTDKFRSQKRRMISGTKVKRVSGADLAKVRIPVPPVVIQREIVRILDAFSSLKAELEAELEARRRQYEHYRDSLLNFRERERIPWLILSDVADVGWGDTSTTKASYVDADSGFTAFSATGPDGYLDHFDYDRTGVVLSAIGARCGKTWLATGRWSCIKNTIRFYSVDESAVLTRFLFWVTSRPALWPRHESAQPYITLASARNLTIPIPPVQEQERIVAILDAFDALANDLSIGLPAELAARRTQYEYYRDRLLTFEERAA